MLKGIVLMIQMVSCGPIINCADAMPLRQSFHTDYLYGCKAEDEEGQDLSCNCMKLQEKGKFNCTCFADDQGEDVEEHYLNCHDALKKGELDSGVYLLKPDNLEPFEVHNIMLLHSIIITQA